MKNIPKLRFPEFVNDGEWEEKKLGHKDICYSISSGKDKNDSNGIFDLYGSTGIIGKSISDSHTGNYILVARVGANAGFLTKASGKFGVTDNTLVLDLHEDVNIDFVFSLLEKFGLNRLIFGSGQPLITGGQLKELALFFPKPKEQKKIADCLSSVDGLISAQSQKIELLKEHKKALMQQLFPSNHPALSGTPPKEGNVPKLRFPEFVNDWAFEELGKLGKFLGGGTPSKLVDEYWHGTIPWISSSDLNEDDLKTIAITRFINEKSISESATKLIPQGSVLFISRVGTGKLAINSVDLCTSQDFTNFIPTQIHNYFLGYYFLANKSTLTSLDQGTSIKGFSKSDLEKMKLFYPKDKQEQQKIADCLSSLDEQISQQTSKLQTLKEHKKALMQQLFPSNHPALSGTPPTEGNSKDENVGDNSQNSPSLKGWQTKSDGVVKSKTTQEDKHA